MLGLGFLFWFSGTMIIRLAGHYLFQPEAVVGVYAGCFVVMALFVRWLLTRLGTANRTADAALLVLPTLLLDPFSMLYAGTLFPNLDAAAVLAFGGCMLICCGGGLVGALWRKA